MKVRGKTVFTMIIGLILLGAFIMALRWPLRTSILIYFICGICLVLLFIELYQEIQGAVTTEKAGGSGMDVPLFKGGEISRDVLAWAWLIGLLLAIWFIGFKIAVPLFVFLFSKIHGARWYLSLFLAFISFGMLYGLFDMVIHVPWPEPLILSIIAK